MVYQLAHLFGVAGARYDVVHYMTDEEACKEHLAGLGLKPSLRLMLRGRLVST
jgi:hypothetical protein